MEKTLRVLVVDDNPDDRLLIKRELSREFLHLQVTEVADPQGLALALAGEPFHLAITDYQLGWNDGLAILRDLKALWPDCPVVMFTGTGNEEVAVEAMKNGLEDYVLKTPRHYIRLCAAVRQGLKHTEQRRALRQAEDRYSRLFNNAPIGLYRITPAGELVEANPALVLLLGYPDREALLAVKAADFYVDPVDKQRWCDQMQHRGEVRGFELQLRKRDGRAVWVRNNARAVRDEAGEILGYEGSLEDVAWEKQAEVKLEEQYRFLQTLIDSIPAPVFYKDAQGVYLGCNKVFEQYFGVTQEQIVGKTVYDISPRDLADVYRQKDEELFRHPGVQVYEGQVELPDGTRRAVVYHKATFVDAGGSLWGLIGVAIDITERKLAEAALETAAHKWQITFDAIGDAVCLLDRENKILQCNQAMATLVGRPFSEIVGRSCWEVVHQTTGPIADCPIGRMWKSRSRETLTLPFGDRWLHVMADPILNKAGEVIGGVHILADITQYKRAETKIRELNILLTAIKDINEALLRVQDEQELFQQTCDLLTKVPYVRFIWIGMLQPDSFEVKPVAWAGVEEGYLAATKVSWDDSSFGLGPTGTAIKTGQPTVVEDTDVDPRYLPWRQEAQKRGYTSSIALPLICEGETLGSLSVYSGNKKAFGSEELEFLNQVAGDIAVGLRSLRLERGLEASLKQMQATIQQTVGALAATVEMRDPYTAGHQRRVTQLACALAQELGLPPEQIEGIRVMGFVHDIGKIAVPAEILSKPGKISPMEFNIIKVHPQVGYDILKDIGFPWPVAQAVLQHHERLDGSGYPSGLTGGDIIPEARILMVADVVEAMSSHRPYRPALGIDQALEEITKNKGILYDPEVVDVCLRLFTEQGFTLS